MGKVSSRFNVDVTMGIYTRLRSMFVPEPNTPPLLGMIDSNYQPGDDNIFKAPEEVSESSTDVLPHFLTQVYCI